MTFNKFDALDAKGNLTYVPEWNESPKVTFTLSAYNANSLTINMSAQARAITFDTKTKLAKALEYLGDKWVFHPKNRVKKLSVVVI